MFIHFTSSSKINLNQRNKGMEQAEAIEAEIIEKGLHTASPY
jgi:hypothetical protein